MTEKIRILVLSSNPWSTGRILVAEETREISKRIQEGPYRDKFEVHHHCAVRPIDLQRLLLTYEPQIVHFSGHGSKGQKILLNGTNGRAQALDQQGLRDIFGFYNNHVRLVLLNACFSKSQARSISEVVDYSIGTARPIGDKASVAFAGAFYRALGFGKSIRDAFKSARAELAVINMPRSRGIELFVRDGINKGDRFPQTETHRDPPAIPANLVKANAIVEVTTIKTIQQTILVRG
jgi:CHAT domain-containing protein